jgi:hypothetical protein
MSSGRALGQLVGGGERARTADQGGVRRAEHQVGLDPVQGRRGAARRAGRPYANANSS